jgi:hypothetical protein
VQPVVAELAVLVEEAENVLEPEATIATLADPVERELAAVAEPLDRIDVEMKHLRDFGGGKHRSDFVDCHRGHCHGRLSII